MKYLHIFSLLALTILFSCQESKTNKSFNVIEVQMENFDLTELALFFVAAGGSDQNDAIVKAIEQAKLDLNNYNEENQTTFKISDLNVQSIAFDPNGDWYVCVLKVNVTS